MRIGRIEFGITKHFISKNRKRSRIRFTTFKVDTCHELGSCIMFDFLCFYVTILRGDCYLDAKEGYK